MMSAVITPSDGSSSFSVAGLFAGIGGLELGLGRAGGRAELLCECWEPAREVLRARFPGVEQAGDIRELDKLPDVEVVTSGFPCTDLSQAGRTEGIRGSESGLVEHLFRLLRDAAPRWVVIENVRNMLVLDGGSAMRYLVRNLENLGYRWAYRLVDSRFTGIPQRRQRVIFVASKGEDPTRVLFADDAGKPDDDDWFRDDAFGFYWTEGLTGLGWARDCVPTLKGGSSLGIPSAPAIWIPDREPGSAIGTPGIRAAEEMQGFPAGWTQPAEEIARASIRWKLVGNAVTVGVADWLGRRLREPGEFDRARGVPLTGRHRWPTAAWGEAGKRWSVELSMWPERRPYRHLLDILDDDGIKPLSKRAIDGFHSRMERSRLRFDEQFRLAVKKHAAAVSG